MPEINTQFPAKVIMGFNATQYLCDECETPVKQTDVAYMVNPPLYQHICPNCGIEYKFRTTYPRLESLWQ